MPLPPITDFQIDLTDIVSNGAAYNYGDNSPFGIYNVVGETIFVTEADGSTTFLWAGVPILVGELYALRTTYNVGAGGEAAITAQGVGNGDVIDSGEDVIYFIAYSTSALIQVTFPTTPLHLAADFQFELLKYEPVVEVPDPSTGPIIETVLLETAAAADLINFYGRGPEAYLENLDRMVDAPAADAKFPILWVYEIKLSSKPFSDVQPVPLDRTYTIRAVLAKQFQWSDSVDELIEVLKYTMAVATQFEIRLKNHPAIDPEKPLTFNYQDCVHMYSDNLVGWWIDITMSVKEHIDNHCIPVPTSLVYETDGYVSTEAIILTDDAGNDIDANGDNLSV